MARFPGPRVAGLTKWWLRWHEIRGRRDQTIEALHKKYGRLVQISPKQISVNDNHGIRDIFMADRYLDRPSPLLMLHNYKSENLVSTVDGELHQRRRKPLRSLYSARAVETPEKYAVFASCLDSLIGYIDGEIKLDKVVDIFPMFRWLGADILTQLALGKDYSLGIFADEEHRVQLKADVQLLDDRIFSIPSALMLFFPRFIMWLDRMRMLPNWFDLSPSGSSIFTRSIRKHITQLRRHETIAPAGFETHAERLMNYVHAQGYSDAIPDDNYIMSDTLDHISAGTSTTADVLCAAVFHLSHPKHIDRQRRLRDELAQSGITSAATPSFAQVKQVAYLECVIQETLRRNPPVSGSIERKVPPQTSVQVSGHTLHEGMEFSAQPYSVHRNKMAFSDAESWNPERWDIPHHSESYGMMRRHMMPFGAGPRMCIGMNVARAQLRLTLARIYSSFRTALAPDWFDQHGAVIDFDKKKSLIPSKNSMPIIFERLPFEGESVG
ncbi:hypothetical protein B0A52_01999 [Exophiala mesophila]|uniref:Cytochrome P450 n=1 Tax=Exophiala mesophila TaxID=212818 RepID=A0A438NEM0_EXOME|nr:hypothetical protein B0A52_01999 [Exophiala mesophila]